MNFNTELLVMKQKVEAAGKSLDALIEVSRSPVRFNTLLDSAMQQMEVTCIEMRRIAEIIRPQSDSLLSSDNSSKTIYGEINLTKEGWLYIKLNTLLPHYKVLGGTGYISDSISRLLDIFVNSGGVLPCYEKAFLGIIEHCSVNACKAFDSDNKGYKSVINTLKARVFEDDNQFELSLGLFTVDDSENYCNIYVLPVEDSAKFMWLKTEVGL